MPMTSTQWFILVLFAIAMWGGNRAFSTYLDKKYGLQAQLAHERTLQAQIETLKAVIEVQKLRLR